MQSLWKAVWSFLQKLKVELPYDPVSPVLGIFPKKPETLIYIHTHTHTHIFIAVLFTIGKI